MDMLLQLVTVGLLVESVWESAKMLWQDGKFNINTLGALVLGILVCILAEIDLFSLIGINLKIVVVGQILTGIIVSRGSNFIHDLLAKLSESRSTNTNVSE